MSAWVRWGQWLQALAASALLLAPGMASACASCAARPDEGHRTVYFIAAMCLLPLVVGGVALAIIRNLDSDGEQRAPSHETEREAP